MYFYLLVAAGLVVASLILNFQTRATTTTTTSMAAVQEPPQAPASFPIIGHALGILKSKFNYYVQLSHKVPHDVFTLSMPGQKMYIITTPDMIQAVQKQPKVFAFPPIEAKFSRAVCGVSDDAHQILMNNVNGDEGDWGLSMESYAAMKEALKPGPNLDSMNRIMISSLDTCLNTLKPSSTATSKSKNILLVEWLRHSVTLATTDAVYGPQNPYKDPKITNAFWNFEADLMTILMGFFPKWTAAKGVSGRAEVARAFETYFKAGAHEQGSELVKKRYTTSHRNGISIEDISRYEVGGSIAVLVNTTPAIFWMLFLIYSHPTLLEDIREEIKPLIVTTTDAADGSLTRTVDMTSLKENCPLLVSTLQETLRFRSMGTSVRQVMEDSTLQNKWLLKKDCMIQMPSRVIHLDENVWGPTASEFEPRRFMKESRVTGSKKTNPSAFRAFGGGSTLCPGRHFATNEILVTVVMFALRFDMQPVGKDQKWVMPTVDKTNVAAVIMEPDTDIEVEVSPRRGAEEGRWVFDLQDSEKVFALVAEDRDKQKP